MKKTEPWHVGAVLLIVFAGLLAWAFWSEQAQVEVVPYSVFEQALRDGKIADVSVGSSLVTGRRKAAEPSGKPVMAAVLVAPDVAARLSAFNVPYQGIREASWSQSLWLWILPLLFMVGLVNALGRRAGGMRGGLMGIGRNRARIYMEKNTGVRFADVAGVDEAKAELQEIVDFLKHPQEHGRLGARMPKGILLMGPTGTGKTLLARAVAGEAGVAFFSISGSEFIEMFVGVGAARVRDLFEQARANAPAIIFIDELDALGKTRSALSIAGGQDEREQTLNQLLVELDGFDPSVGVVLLAATNRPETLDPALLRAGRFDRQVLVDRPDRAGRRAILAVHVRQLKLDPALELDQVAAITVGFAGADLANLVNEAALAATRRDAESVAMEDFTQAIERIVAGIAKKSSLLGPRERNLVATHELGHALVAWSLPGTDKVHKVSIVPHGIGALGYTLQRPSEDRHLLGRSELLDRLAVLLGGRAAEVLVHGEPTTGAADDLVKATNLARDMVRRYGMDNGIGPVVFEDVPSPWLGPRGDGLRPARSDGASEATAHQIDRAVQTLLEQALLRAIGILRARRTVLDRCVEELVRKETLDASDLRALGADLPVAQDAAPAGSYVSPPASQDTSGAMSD